VARTRKSKGKWERTDEEERRFKRSRKRRSRGREWMRETAQRLGEKVEVEVGVDVEVTVEVEVEAEAGAGVARMKSAMALAVVSACSGSKCKWCDPGRCA
jgi:hypothetical protein